MLANYLWRRLNEKMVRWRITWRRKETRGRRPNSFLRRCVYGDLKSDATGGARILFSLSFSLSFSSPSSGLVGLLAYFGNVSRRVARSLIVGRRRVERRVTLENSLQDRCTRVLLAPRACLPACFPATSPLPTLSWPFRFLYPPRTSLSATPPLSWSTHTSADTCWYINNLSRLSSWPRWHFVFMFFPRHQIRTSDNI